MLGNDIVKLVNALFRVRDNKGKLVDYRLVPPHQKMLRTGILGDSTARYRIINKGRQGGFSIFQGIETLLIAQLMPNTWQYYVATKEDQSKSWLKKVEKLAYDSRLWFDGSRLIDIDENKSTQLMKIFKHYPKETQKQIEESYIVGLAASPEGIRGETAINIVLDEFPNMTQRINLQMDLYRAVRAFISQGGQMTIQGTPIVKTDKFWDMYINADEYLLTPYYCPIIENWEQVDLHKDLRNQKLDIPYYWTNTFELEQMRRTDLDSFKQEILGIPADEMVRFLSPELIAESIVSTPLFENRNGLGNYKIAMDLAQKRDMTAITVGEIVNGVIWERHVEDTQAPYTKREGDEVEGQMQILKRLCRRYKPLEIIIDNTGVGITIGDMIEADPSFPPLRRIDFQSNVVLGEKKVRMTHYLAEEFKRALVDRRYMMIPHETALDHLKRIEKIVTDTSIRYSGKRGQARDDHFWSKCLLAANFKMEDANPVFEILDSVKIMTRQKIMRNTNNTYISMGG